MITYYDIRKLEMHVKDRLRTPELDGLFNNLYQKVALESPDPEETIILVSIVGSKKKVQLVECCPSLKTCVEAGDVHAKLSGGEYSMTISLVHVHLYLEYCPFCGIKFNIKNLLR